jgi:hypothetical protein
MEFAEKRGRTMRSQSNIIRNMMKVIGFMAFIPLTINTVFSDIRITAGRQRRATIRGEQLTTNPA